MHASLTSFRDQRGQTLLEVLIAMVILITALVGTVALIVNSISASRESRNRLIATSLAREAIEMARSTRDSNWVTDLEKICAGGGANDGAICIADSDCDGNSCLSESWDTGLIGVNPAIPVLDGSSPYHFDFSPINFNDPLAEIFLVDEYYRQGSGVTGSGSSFFRLVYVNPICHDSNDVERIVDRDDNFTCGQGGTSVSSYLNTVGYRVISEVRWPNSNSTRKVIIEDRLYNWQTL